MGWWLVLVVWGCLMWGHAHCYVQNQAALTEVPHALIPSDETLIDLGRNQISMLGPNEFSAYPGLTHLRLYRNNIASIDSTAFDGTIVEVLQLYNNPLTSFPDLSAIRLTLKSLLLYSTNINNISKQNLDLPVLDYLMLMYSNQLSSWPDFSLVGRDTTEQKMLNINAPLLPSYEMVPSMCGFEVVQWNSVIGVVPTIPCDPQNSTLETLILGRRSYTENTDFQNLSPLAMLPAFNSLDLRKNEFTGFPDLPFDLRTKLESLLLDRNHIASIPDPQVLEGYSLQSLVLSNNDFPTIPVRLFSITQTLDLSHLELLEDWSPHLWNNPFCNDMHYQLTTINLINSISNVMKFPEINTFTCQQPNITISLKDSVMPCDCSVAWLWNAQQRCNVTFETDNDACWHNDSISCPENFIMLYEDEIQHVVISQESTAVQPPTIAQVVRGSEWWTVHVNGDPETASVFPNGAYFSNNITGITHVYPTVPYVLVGHAGENCPSTGRAAELPFLTNAYPTRFMSIENEQLEVKVRPYVGGQDTYVVKTVTEGMDCSLPFFLAVYYRTRVENCVEMSKCPVVTSQTNGDGLSTCHFHCTKSSPWSPGRRIFVRFASIQPAKIHELTVLALTLP